jgi:homoserine dehydrogenase
VAQLGLERLLGVQEIGGSNPLAPTIFFRQKDTMKTNMKNQKNIVRVGLLGLGTVGTGVARILIEKSADIRRETGLEFQLAGVCVRKASKKRSIALRGVRVTTDAASILRDPKIDQVVELIGGLNPAGAHITDALKSGKDVVSANKALFAERGLGLYKLARQTGRHIGIEAAVCGGIPVIQGIERGLASNRMSRILGILNGTCNYILTEMSRGGKSYPTALKEAQAAGFAESDPTLDVNGTDTAHKLAILARLAFKFEIPYNTIHREGIERITAEDIRYAAELGYTVKLLALGSRGSDNRIELRVHPALLESKHLLANVSGVNNAVLVSGDETGEIMFYGRGAGQRPTASAVVSDMIAIAQDRRHGVNNVDPIYSAAKVLPIQTIESRYYLRFDVVDRPGVFGALAQTLGRNGISLSSVVQKETHKNPVSVVVLTHRTQESRVDKALTEISRQSIVKAKPIRIRIVDSDLV